MTRPLPTRFAPVDPMSYAYGWPIRAGATGVGERDLLENMHFVYGYTTPQMAATLFNSDAGYIVCTNAAAYELRGLWRRRQIKDLPQWRGTVYAHNTSAVADAYVKFQLQSDATKNVVLTINPGATWGYSYGTWNANGTPDRETVQMWLKAPNDPGQELRVRSASVWPHDRNAVGVTAGKSTDGFVPLDTDECTQNAPLSVHYRQTQLSNCEVIRKTRGDSYVGWCEDTQVRTPATYAAYKTTSASYVVVANIGFKTFAEQTTLEWSAYGYRTGASGYVRLRTGHMIDNSIAAVELPLGNTWTSDYSGAGWDNTGGSELTTLEDYADYVEVAIKSDGVGYTYLMGLNIWAKPIA